MLRLAVPLLIAAFAGSALADDPTVVNDHFTSTKTRAEVMAEAAASRARGDFVFEGDEIVMRHPAASDAPADTLVAQRH